MNERVGRSIHTRMPSVRCQRGVAMLISNSPCIVFPHSRFSTRSIMSRPLSSWALADGARHQTTALSAAKQVEKRMAFIFPRSFRYSAFPQRHHTHVQSTWLQVTSRPAAGPRGGTAT
jgi:hypothetical protein